MIEGLRGHIIMVKHHNHVPFRVCGRRQSVSMHGRLGCATACSICGNLLFTEGITAAGSLIAHKHTMAVRLRREEPIYRLVFVAVLHHGCSETAY